MNCPELFTGVAKDRDKASKVDQQSPECACEAHSVSPHSPGVVQDEETIWRLILSPIHFDVDTGMVKEAAFSDVQTWGMSVQRLVASSTENSIRSLGQARAAAKPGRAFERAVGALVGKVRTLRDPSTGGRFCVYDTADPDSPLHADVCQTFHGGGQTLKQMRRELQKVFSQVIDPT